ncbi:MAG: anaerobic ribonucleoside-triphosphate reductase activating protein [gamma proteobacterium endosymbiont of Lamellibrachia anaximandri]|nr:anaerobic ribonucleoside-triphosphate reductase activating protein [gamma proteobacterium endosymbiont of Lamellibrachia anaximandri]MBL3532224.1 anaerobic ribonucleoside-triphosphate reductase activating protein [gamma proteobacterium endosymbiont of Lamellibrachia anaximandri]
MQQTTLQVGGLTPMTTIDYPGELAAVIFCQGCPWRCCYCHNGHLLPRMSSEPGLIEWDEIIAFLERRQGLLDAVVFSGGEPTLQSALKPAIQQVKAMGFKIGLHSAGVYPERLAELLPLLDWVGLDIKALAEDYAALTGVSGSGEKAWESLRLLVASGVAYEVRTTVHTELLSPQNLKKLQHQLQQTGVAHHQLQQCDTRHALDQRLSA